MPARKLIFSACLFGLLFALTAGSTAQAAGPLGGSHPVFGVVEGFYRADDAQSLGVGWDRITFPWNLFQPGSGTDFKPDAVPEGYLSTARAAGRGVVGLIKGTPAWASSTGTLGAVPRGLGLPFNDPGNTFGVFMAKLVQHFAPLGIHDWIIWNEPDIRPGEGTVEFEGRVADYFKLLKVAYLAGHGADPNIHVQIAGMSWWYDVQHGRQPYLRRLLAEISADPDAQKNNWYFDGVTSHIYFTTDSVWTILNATRAILDQFGLSKKELWLAEYNASPRRDPAALIKSRFQLSLDQQADFVVQASALALAAGANRLAVYRLYDNGFVPGQSEPWGLIRADGSKRPAYFAYQQVIQRFSGASSIRRFSIPDATLVTVSFAGRTVYVMWSNTFTAGQFFVPGSGVTVYDAVGKSVATTNSGPFTVIDAPGAEKIDLPTVVVAGAVRIVSLPGSARNISYRVGNGQVIALN